MKIIDEHGERTSPAGLQKRYDIAYLRVAAVVTDGRPGQPTALVLAPDPIAYDAATPAEAWDQTSVPETVATVYDGHPSNAALVARSRAIDIARQLGIGFAE